MPGPLGAAPDDPLRHGPGTGGLVLHPPLHEERLVISAPAGHDLAARRRLDIDESRSQARIDFAPGTDLAATVEAFDRRYRLRREVTAQVNPLDVLVDLVRDGPVWRLSLPSCREPLAPSRSNGPVSHCGGRPGRRNDSPYPPGLTLRAQASFTELVAREVWTCWCPSNTPV
ncbi:LysR substrate-binding domain-containing protein [Streptomyces sp. MUSC 14]|uniref:LysR substrate-binding domain-containing protein n=1 Tax=Streptomyces sp. MUSC 14 TaxID=1354889 RepID=UPI0009A0A60D|nr:LysR substrate-binding domain-containing protein [Streptomyces sp. MUSC 14]